MTEQDQVEFQIQYTADISHWLNKNFWHQTVFMSVDIIER